MNLPRWLALAALAAFGTGGEARAQELRVEPIPFSVWLDFAAMSRPHDRRWPLPIWLESVRREAVVATTENPGKTTFRLQLRRIGALNREMELRLFSMMSRDWPQR